MKHWGFKTPTPIFHHMMRMAQDAAEDILRVLKGEKPKYPVNREVLKR